MDIAAWLRQLGLGQYEQAFRDNAVDAEVLPKLTSDDLKEIGVVAVGHRRKLLEAVAALRAGPPAARADAGGAETSAGRGLALPVSRAERRQLTVMFVDLVGSTALSRRLDPEEMREVLRAYQNAVAGEVARFEGHVAKFMGDGVLAYFGWPRAHEDEAERAVRAGCAVVEVVGQLRIPSGEALAARVDIATGLVVVGDLIGEGAAQEQAVIGETPNLAARLQQLADPGTVVVAETTRRLLGTLFEFADLGPQEVRGMDVPIRAFRVTGEGRAEGRFEARHAGGSGPLVGREQELALLLDRWRLAKGSEGQVVLLGGEPGIGKSRLVLALRERLRAEPRTSLRYFGSPYHTQSALWPVIGQLERAAALEAGDPPEAKLDKLEALLGQAVAEVAAVAPVFAELLGIPAGGRYPALPLTPQQRKAQTFRVLLAQLEGLAQRTPVLVVLEDAQWFDPTTLELFDLVVGGIERLPVLLVVTFRPEFRPPWLGRAHVTLLTLSRLGRSQAAEVVTRVTDGRALPPEVLDQILAKTDGIPLFVEELTKAVLEAGLLREDRERYVLDGPVPPLAIPDTLRGSLLARLDRLAPAKEVAQVGAAIGREFSHELLAAVTPLPEDRLLRALDELVAAELVFRRGVLPDVVYFKHALVRDAAYGTLLKSRRQQLHSRIVRTLEERFPEQVETQPELLARHCTEAGLVERAVEYWYRAGQRAIARSAIAEAVAQLTEGLRVLQSLPGGPERDRRELELQIALGVALTPLKGQAAPETGQVYARARELSRSVGETEQLLPVLYGQ